MTDSPLRLQVASPCTADWNTMEGDDRCRFCSRCQKNVYNLEGLSETEIRELAGSQDSPFCARFYQRADGMVLTSNCPVGAADSRRRLRKRITVLAFVGFIAAGIANFARASSSEAGSDSPLLVTQWINELKQYLGIGVTTVPPEEVLMGEICIPEPPDVPESDPAPPEITEG